LRPRAIAARLWRPLVGATAMACVLTTAGLSWNQVATKGGAIEQLAIGVPLGMVVYATVLAGLWLASGRPEGAEQDLLELLGRLVPRARRLWAQTAGPASG
jgi:PST family polysaccharide transporter